MFLCEHDVFWLHPRGNGTVRTCKAIIVKSSWQNHHILNISPPQLQFFVASSESGAQSGGLKMHQRTWHEEHIKRETVTAQTTATEPLTSTINITYLLRRMGNEFQWVLAGVVSVVDKQNGEMFDEPALVAYRLLIGVVHANSISFCFLTRVWEDFLLSRISILRNFYYEWRSWAHGCPFI